MNAIEKKARIVRAHYSDKPIESLRNVEMPLSHIDFKPRGFWWSCNHDWERWCAAESFADTTKQLRYLVTLGKARMLRLTSPEAILKFTRDFCVQGKTMLIAWPAVSTVYDGIEIVPYQWECRLDGRCRWYYAWDCASGVSWNASKLRIRCVSKGC